MTDKEIAKALRRASREAFKEMKRSNFTPSKKSKNKSRARQKARAIREEGEIG